MNLSAVDNDYVQFFEDDEHVYINIGRNAMVNAVWKESFDRIKMLENKYNQALRDILAQAQAALEAEKM